MESNTNNETIKTAYDIIKQHDQPFADQLLENFRASIDDMKLMVDRKCEREAKYTASIWQRLTLNKSRVLRPFKHGIEDAKIRYYIREGNMLRNADDLCDKINLRKEAEIEEGNFVYYIVDVDTNVRNTEKGVPVIYSTRDAAARDLQGEYDTVISIAEYNRRYGKFMDK